MIFSSPTASERSLVAIADNAQGISGRTLRKIPFLALMKYCAGAQQVTLDNYLNAIEKAIESDKVERKHLSGNKKLFFNFDILIQMKTQRWKANRSLPSLLLFTFLFFTFLISQLPLTAKFTNNIYIKS